MCQHKSVRFATSSDMQDICLDCGAVVKDFAKIEILFNTRSTACGCTVTMKTPKRTQVKRFRNGYASARASAKQWIAGQIEAYREHAAVSDGRECVFLVDGNIA